MTPPWLGKAQKSVKLQYGQIKVIYQYFGVIFHGDVEYDTLNVI